MKNIILDGDGVVVDYRPSYARVWKKAFGTELPVVHPNSYHAHIMYDLHLRDRPDISGKFFEHFTEDVWESLPACEGAIEACQALHEAGHVLICVTSIPKGLEAARLRNFQTLGIPIDRVIATGRSSELNPKLDIIHQLNPVAFVDDLGSNFIGVRDDIHKALIHGQHHDNPNNEEYQAISTSIHLNLADFAKYWLAR